MDKFLLYNGGMPIYLDDIKYLDTVYRETFKQLLQAFNLPSNISCIIKGCQITETQSNYQISDGIIALNGELLYAPQQIVNKYNVQGQTYYWSVDTDYYTDGYKLLQNGITVPAWEKRWAYVSYGVPPANHLPLFGARYLLDYINDYSSAKLKDYVENEIIVVGAFYPGWSSSSQSPVRFYKDLTRRVFLSGKVIKTQNAGALIFILPYAYRPQYAQTFILPAIDQQNNEILVKIDISNIGFVSVVHNYTNGNVVKEINFDGVSFRI